ncbi:MAG: AAA family ATPase [Myxococcota bacterium]
MKHVERLIEELDRDDAYPHDATRRELHQTHISVVFLAGDYAYKLKKPVDFGFVDYSALEARKRFCQLEIELNRRLAEDVYLGVWAAVETDEGLALRDSRDVANEDVVEWAVRMRRLDQAKTLGPRLERGELQAGVLERLGDLIARFHTGSERGPKISEYAKFETVTKNALDNFSQTRDHVGLTVAPGVHARLEALFEATLTHQHPVIDARAATDVACDTHGDLRLEHIHIDDDAELRIVDCIEFNDAFRYADPISDIAFLAMDLLIRGYRDETSTILDEYFTVNEDPRGRRLLPLYVAYRSAVRAKVHGFKASEDEVPAEERAAAVQRARMHWNFALRVLAPVSERPRLLLIGGLPGTGKSTVARSLRDADWVDDIIDTDHVRKELAGLSDADVAADDFEGGIYTAEWTEKTYDACLERAREVLEQGRRVAVDASFRGEDRRRPFIELGLEMGTPPVFLECALPETVTRERLAGREGDVSDADVDIYEKMKATWDPASAQTDRFRLVLPTTGAVDEVAERAVNLLREYEAALFG